MQEFEMMLFELALYCNKSVFFILDYGLFRRLLYSLSSFHCGFVKCNRFIMFSYKTASIFIPLLQLIFALLSSGKAVPPHPYLLFDYSIC